MRIFITTLLILFLSLSSACQKQQLELANTDAPEDAPKYNVEANPN
ncbi:MAG: hypothetical protein R3A13_08375 [Bdellovibrionota bacterium]